MMELRGQLLGDIMWACYMSWVLWGVFWRLWSLSWFMIQVRSSPQILSALHQHVKVYGWFLHFSKKVRYINSWEAFWGFKLRQPHFRQKKNLPANVLQDPASSCFSHWGGRRLKIFFLCTTLPAWTTQKVVGGASGKHTPCALQHESTTGELWNFSWNLVLTRIRLLDLSMFTTSTSNSWEFHDKSFYPIIRNYHINMFNM